MLSIIDENQEFFDDNIKKVLSNSDLVSDYQLFREVSSHVEMDFWLFGNRYILIVESRKIENFVKQVLNK